MTTPAGRTPCVQHPPLLVMGGPDRWTATCKICVTVYHSDDPELPVWVREFAGQVFADIATVNAPQNGQEGPA